MLKFLNELADNDSALWRETRDRPLSIRAYIQYEARKALKA
jgi:hypothetical protein